MSHILDTREEIAKLDTKMGLLSLEQVGSQIKQVWEETRDIIFPDSYKHVRNIVVAGMGGSAYGTHVIQSLFKDELKVPILSIPDYTLPSWVNEDTLVILSSYSGSTEETLSAGEDAKKKGAKISGLTSGGKLAEFFRTGHHPCYVFTPTFNPCNTPRYAVGYSIFGQMALLERAGYLHLTGETYQEILDVVSRVQLRVSIDVPTQRNGAKLLSFEVLNRIPIVTVAEHLEGAGHVVANAFNETSKSFSEYRVIPEINHHLMEGLAFPSSNEKDLLFLLIQSKLYSSSNAKRMLLTSQVIEKNYCEYKEIKLTATTKIGQVFELLLLGTYTAFYVAMLYGQDPVPNPWVDWFKAELKK